MKKLEKLLEKRELLNAAIAQIEAENNREKEKKYWLVRDCNKLEQIEVLKATTRFAIIKKSGSDIEEKVKMSDGNIFDTHEKAKAFLADQLSDEILLDESRLKDKRAVLKKIKNLKDGVEYYSDIAS